MPDAPCALARRFLALARRAPDAVALLGPDGTTLATRGELAGRAQARASVLAPLPRSGPVVLSLPNGIEFIASFLALRRRGLVPALADAAAPAGELAGCAATVGAAAVLTLSERAPAGRTVWQDGPLCLVALDVPPVPLPTGTDVLKLTSGSTGAPSAVAVSARQLAADAVQILRTMGVRHDDVTLAAIPLTHSYGLSSCLVPLLLTGLPLAFPTCALPAALAETLERARVAHFPAVPAMVRALAKLPQLPRMAALRICLTAGAPLAPRDAAAFFEATGRTVHVFYGSSECGGITYDRRQQPEHAAGCVGTPMDRVVVDAIDADGRVARTGDEGRVRVRSRAVALGIVPVPGDGGPIRDGAFLTGDLGRFDGEGRLTLTGRVSEMLNVAGKKVHPGEIRAVLEAIPGVTMAVVVGIPDRHRGDLVAAVVATEPGAVLTVHNLLKACRVHLAPHKVPRRLVIVDEMPVSDRGKLRRDELLRLFERAGSAS